MKGNGLGDKLGNRLVNRLRDVLCTLSHKSIHANGDWKRLATQGQTHPEHIADGKNKRTRNGNVSEDHEAQRNVAERNKT